MYILYPAILIRSLCYILISILTLYAFNSALPHTTASAKGIILPTKNSRVAVTVPESVRLLPFSPNKFQNLGQVNVEVPVKGEKNNQQAAQEAEKYAKKLAAQLGADAIVVTSYGVSSFGEAAADSNFYVFRGIAIHLDKAVL